MNQGETATNTRDLTRAIARACGRMLKTFSARLDRIEQAATQRQATPTITATIESDSTNRRCFDLVLSVNGVVTRNVFRIPSVIYRDVYDTELEYSEGDAVTHQGALWICRSLTKGAAPGTSTDWRLAVKRGAAS